MSPGARTLATLWVALAAATILAAQEQRSGPQDPTFRTSIQSVRVDLYVTRDGKPVTDLRRDEIELLEDGVPQTIQTFERIRSAAHAPPSGDPHRSMKVGRAPPIRARGCSSSSCPCRAQPLAGRRGSFVAAVLVQQLNGLLGPDDLVAMVTPDTPISELTFQRRLALGQHMVDEVPDDPGTRCGTSVTPRDTGEPERRDESAHQELMTFAALDALIGHLGGLREERKHVLVLTKGFRLF